MSSPGIFAEQVESFRACPGCGLGACICEREEPILAAWQDNYSGAWHSGDTGRIITVGKAMLLLGRSKGCHASKCECSDCIEEKQTNQEGPDYDE